MLCVYKAEENDRKCYVYIKQKRMTENDMYNYIRDRSVGIDMGMGTILVR